VEKLVPRLAYIYVTLYIKLRLASLDVRIAYVHGVGVAVHNHGRFVRITYSGCKTWFSLCRTVLGTRLKKSSSVHN